MLAVKDSAKELREKEENEQVSFYTQCMEFHLKDESIPCFQLSRTNKSFSGIYIDENKGMNFLTIDGERKTECCALIKYDDIHYYERAGKIHYVAETTVSKKTFGGYYQGASFSKTGTVVGGLLFGTMGMVAGALLTSNSSVYVPPKDNIDYSTQIKEIDGRTVILNYYSEKKKQYMDMALQPEVFNFLQTNFPEKNYEIVMALEKEKAIQRYNQEQTSNKQEDNTGLDSFKEKVEKLKILYDSGVISEDEFNEKRHKLMEEL